MQRLTVVGVAVASIGWFGGLVAGALAGCTVQRSQPNLVGQDIRLTVIHTADIHSRLYPYNFVPNTVVYTGTHDNDTTVGWFTSGVGDSTRTQAEVNEEREFVLKYLGTDGREINWDFIRLALSSVANTAIIPLQDVLGCGSEERMNIPARESGNWGWRYRAEQLTLGIRARLKELAHVYGRDRQLLKLAAKKQAEVVTNGW